MKINPISGALGAEISGLDLSVKPSNSHISRLYEAFLKRRVLFFREQTLSATDLLKFSKIFGEPAVYPFIEGLPDVPEVIEIIKTESDEKNFGGVLALGHELHGTAGKSHAIICQRSA